MEAISEGKKRYECQLCSKDFSRQSDLRQHVDSFHKKVRHTCPTCEKQFTYPSRLKTHIASIHEYKRYSCPTCQQVFSWKSELRQHIGCSQNNERHRCNGCGKEFQRKKSLNKHFKKFHADSSTFTLTITPAMNAPMMIADATEISVNSSGVSTNCRTDGYGSDNVTL